MYSNDITQQAESLTNFVGAIYSSMLSRNVSISSAKQEVNRILMQNISNFSLNDKSVDIPSLLYVAKILRGLLEARVDEISDSSVNAKGMASVKDFYLSLITKLKTLEEICKNGTK